jgi:hypothetical protein
LWPCALDLIARISGDKSTHEAPHCASRLPVNSSHLGPNYLPRLPISSTINLRPSFNAKDRVSHSHKTNNIKIVGILSL